MRRGGGPTRTKGYTLIERQSADLIRSSTIRRKTQGTWEGGTRAPEQGGGDHELRRKQIAKVKDENLEGEQGRSLKSLMTKRVFVGCRND